MRPGTIVFGLSALMVLASACVKEEEGDTGSTGVDIEFRTDSGYTYTNDTVPQGDTVRIGAIITEGSDPLQFFYLTVSYDSAAEIGLDTLVVDTNPFTYDTVYVTRLQPGIEEVFFNVAEADGDRTRRRLTFTVP